MSRATVATASITPNPERSDEAMVWSAVGSCELKRASRRRERERTHISRKTSPKIANASPTSASPLSIHARTNSTIAPTPAMSAYSLTLRGRSARSSSLALVALHSKRRSSALRRRAARERVGAKERRPSRRRLLAAAAAPLETDRAREDNPPPGG